VSVDLSELEDHFGLPKGLLSAVEQQESGGNPNAVSPAGAIGAFQFLPATAAQYGIDPKDPDQSAQGAAQMYSDLLKKYNGDLPSALAAYNWGQGNVDNQGLQNAPPETQKYIASITSALNGQQNQKSNGIMADIGNFLVPSAQAEEMPKQDKQSSNPYDNLSDDQLALEAKRQGIDISQPSQNNPYDQMSDEQLALEAKRQGIDLGQQDLPSDARPGDLPVGFSAYGGELKKSATDAAEDAESGTKDFIRAFTPVTALAKMAMGKDLSSEEKDYLNQGNIAGELSPIADIAKGLGKGALATIGTLFFPVSAANRSFVGNPLENETGLPSGVTDFALSMIEPAAIGKIAGAGASALSKVSDLMDSDKDIPDLSEILQPKSAAQEISKPSVMTNIPAADELPMTAGQATQNPDVQRIEADSLAGARGPTAQTEALNFIQKQQNAVNDMLQNITKGKPDSPSYEPGGNPTDSVNNVVSLIKANEAKASNDVDNAYKTARSLSDGITLPQGDMSKNLVPQVQTFAKNFGIKPQTTPKAASQMEDIIDLSKQNSGRALLEDGETWRRATTNLAANSSDPADAKALRGLVNQYDQYTSDLSSRLSPTDPKSASAINAFKEAVATRRDYGNTFEGNDFVENAINGNKSGDDLAQDLLGNRVGSKQGMLDNLNSTLRASGQNAPVVKAQLQKAYAQQIYNSISGNKIAGSTIDAVSLPKLQTALQNLFVKNREFATTLYGPDAVENAENIIEQLKLINSKQANVGNPSSSGYTLSRLMTSPLSAPIHSIPFLGDALSHVAETTRNAQYAKDASEVFSGKTPNAYQKNKIPTKRIGAAAAASSLNDQQ